MPEHFRRTLLWGSDEKIEFKWENQEGTWKGEGVRTERSAVFRIQRLFRQTQSEYTRRWYMSFMSQQPCAACGGTRLCAEARHVTIGRRTLPEVLNMTIQEAYQWATRLSNGHASEHFNAEQIEIVGEVLKEIRSRLRFMLDVDLHYLACGSNPPRILIVFIHPLLLPWWAKK